MPIQCQIHTNHNNIYVGYVGAEPIWDVHEGACSPDTCLRWSRTESVQQRRELQSASGGIC